MASKVRGPRVLFYDLETSHNILAAFRLWEPGGMSVPYGNILQERRIICAGWKWLGERDVHVVATYTNDDSAVCKAIAREIAKADVVVYHNGDAYDVKFLAARLIVHGLKPAAPARSIDTKKLAKRAFLFNCNRLDYLGQLLGLGKKVHHTDGLWLKALEHDRKAIDAIVRYNKGDVRLLERIFLRMRPWMDDAVNRELFGGLGCPRCGSRRVTYQGSRTAKTRRYRRLQCQACGGWLRETRTMAPSTRHQVL